MLESLKNKFSCSGEGNLDVCGISKCEFKNFNLTGSWIFTIFLVFFFFHFERIEIMSALKIPVGKKKKKDTSRLYRLLIVIKSICSLLLTPFPFLINKEYFHKMSKFLKNKNMKYNWMVNIVCAISL